MKQLSRKECKELYYAVISATLNYSPDYQPAMYKLKAKIGQDGEKLYDALKQAASAQATQRALYKIQKAQESYRQKHLFRG